MKYSYFFIGCILLSATLYSCKEGADKLDEKAPVEAAVISEETKTEINNTSQKVIANSLLAKLMVTPECKSFAQKTLNAGLTDMLSKEEGPFTLLVPSNAAFDGISKYKQQELSQVQNLEKLTTLLKNHMVAGNFSSADLTQSVKKNGAHTLKMLGGANLMVYLDGTNIMVKDASGVAATIGKSDILGNNGTVHMIDVVLSMPK